jgi:hypothetical protein
LFEPTDIEHNTIFISNLRDEKTIPIISSTVLKNAYYKQQDLPGFQNLEGQRVLETLPNIDINIKCDNTLSPLSSLNMGINHFFS